MYRTYTRKQVSRCLTHTHTCAARIAPHPVTSL